MEELVKIFGKYFPKEFENLDINKKEINIKDENFVINFRENSANIIKINLIGKSKIILDVSKLKNAISYVSISLSNNSELDLNIFGKILSKTCLALEIIGNKQSKAKILEKTLVLGEYVNIYRLIVPEEALNSEIELNQYFMMFKNGKIINLPILDVKEKKCIVKHSSKKIKLTEDQLFYLESKSFSKESIINLLEKSFLKI
ncbi:MAG: SufD family Fe-S cluster assembly protein [Nanopusillaceae archaeon]